MRQQKIGKSNLSGEGFWRFSLAFYARPGIPDALIALQDRAGLDVNLMLFALWRGAMHGQGLQASELRAAAAAIAPLRREIVGPLRELRRRLKPVGDADIQALRRRVLGLELAAERAVQSRLAALPADVARARPLQRAARVALVAVGAVMSCGGAGAEAWEGDEQEACQSKHGCRRHFCDCIAVTCDF